MQVPVAAGAQRPSASAEVARWRLAKQVGGREAPEGAGAEGTPERSVGAGCRSKRFLPPFCQDKKEVAVRAKGESAPAQGTDIPTL